MRIDPRYKLRQVADEWILMLLGEAGGELTRVIAFNETSRALWCAFQGCDFEPKEVADWLCKHYDVEPARAEGDARRWIETLKRYGVVR